MASETKLRGSHVRFSLGDIRKKSTPVDPVALKKISFLQIPFKKKRQTVKFRTEYLSPRQEILDSFSEKNEQESDKHIWSRRSRYGSSVEDDSYYEDDVVVIERPIYTQKEFDKGFEGGKRPDRNITTWVQSKVESCECSCACLGRFIIILLPFLSIMADYSIRDDLLPDIIAGVTVGIMHIPQGMAYGQLTSLPPVYGLYISFFPVIVYFFLGTSRHVSIGTFAVVSLMVGSVVDKHLKIYGVELTPQNVTLGDGINATSYITDNSEEILDMKIKLAMSVSLVVGVIQILLGVFQLGFLTVYLSDPLVSGFTTGAACHVFTSQVKHVFGIRMKECSGTFKLIFFYKEFIKNLPNTNLTTFVASIVCMLVLVIVKEYINNTWIVKRWLRMPVPIELIAVITGTVVSYYFKLEEKYQVKVVGDVPLGLPAPNLAGCTYLREVATDAVALAVVGFAVSVSMAKIFARKYNYQVDSNQELLAYGMCNVVSSFMSASVSAVSLSRSLVQDNAGGRTQVTGLVSSCVVLFVLMFVGPYFKSLPNCILGSIIIVALKGMFKQFSDLKALWSISTIDFTVWLVAFTATTLLDVDLGLLAGVGFALFTIIIRSQRPYYCLLGQVPGTDIYKDMSVYKSAVETPHIKIFRFDSALFFANTDYFKNCLYKMTVDPKELKKQQKKLDKMKKKEGMGLMNVTIDSSGSTVMRPVVQTEEIPIEDENRNASIGSDIQERRSSRVRFDNVSTLMNSSANQSRSSLANISLGKSSNQTVDSYDYIKELPTLTDVNFIILDCSTMSYVDAMGVKVLQQVMQELRAFNVAVYLAQCKSGVREMFECTNFYKTESKHYLYVTVHDAVISAQLLRWSIIGETLFSHGQIRSAFANI